jgi:catechol 2,3-dioxygenase-like lactoylglutathione lyase family enzyme
MVRNFDHVTIVVRDVEAAKRFFAFLGFKEVKSVVISRKVMEDYMGVKGIEAEHLTLAIENPHTECAAAALPQPAYFAMINEQGGINGRKINFISRDDGYSPQQKSALWFARLLHRISDGRGRHPTAEVPKHFAADCGTAAAATTSASVRRSIVMRSQAIDGWTASKCQRK